MSTKRLGKPNAKGGKAKVDMDAMTDMMQLFVKEFPIDLNAKAAAQRAGYTGKNAGTKLMQNPQVIQALRNELAKRAAECELDAKRVLYELALVAFYDPAHMFDEDGTLLHIKDMPEGIRKAIASCDVETRTTRDGDTVTLAKLKFWNKLDALKLIGNHLGCLGSTVEQKHLHLHSTTTNPYLNAPDHLVIQAMTAMTMLEHSVKGNIIDEDSPDD